jgi:hypothetical protein
VKLVETNFLFKELEVVVSQSFRKEHRLLKNERLLRIKGLSSISSFTN